MNRLPDTSDPQPAVRLPGRLYAAYCRKACQMNCSGHFIAGLVVIAVLLLSASEVAHTIVEALQIIGIGLAVIIPAAVILILRSVIRAKPWREPLVSFTDLDEGTARDEQAAETAELAPAASADTAIPAAEQDPDAAVLAAAADELASPGVLFVSDITGDTGTRQP